MISFGIFTLAIAAFLSPTYGQAVTVAAVCDGDKKQIKCDNGLVIEIVAALYGRLTDDYCPQGPIETYDCVMDNTFEIVQKKCTNKTSCDIFPYQEFYDPCVATLKYLEVKYYCRSPSVNPNTPTPVDPYVPETDSRTVHVCDGGQLVIYCNPGEGINILEAGYGRWSNSWCNRQPINTLDCHLPNVTAIVRTKCQGLQSCNLNIWAEFSDPCFGTLKYLEVKYICESTSLEVPVWAYFWRDYKGRTPGDALVLATTTTQGKIYGGHSNIYCRGNIVHQINRCAKEVLVPLNGPVKTTKNIQILCTAQNNLFEWRSVTSTDYSSIKQPWTWFVGGDQNNNNLGICRVQEGSIVFIGKVLQKQCQYIRNNQECVATTFEILVVKMLAPPKIC